MVKKGKLIVIEGADGTGKSTHAHLLGNHLKERGYEVVITEEPTDGKIGQFIRSVLSGAINVSPTTLALLFTADRAEHVKNIIGPALERGKTVITDRYYYSTIAYQSSQGIDKDWLSEINSFVVEPDIVIVFEITPNDALARMSRKSREVFEVLEFQKKVQKKLLDMASGGYKKLSKPGKTWKIIRTEDDVQKVQEELEEFVDKQLLKG